MAAIVVGLLAACLPAMAQQSPAGKPLHSKAPRTAAAGPIVEANPAAATSDPAAPAEHTAAVTRRKTAPRPKGVQSPALVTTYAAMPEAQRLAIQSDLAWLNYYEGLPGGVFDERAIEAVKAFQKANGGKETGLLSDQERTLLANAAKTPQGAVGWQLIDDPATGARFGLPEKLVAANGASRTGGRWTSGHGQIQVETFRLREAALPALFDQEKTTPRQRRIETSALRADSFVLFGMQGLKRVLVRAEASGTEVRGITILYDQATDGTMGPAAIAMANSFQGFPDPNAAPPPGQKRRVEYGTAIVVDGIGDLITVGQIADACRAITVPGFGHAERIAADKPNDLALIRLYGARNLKPAGLGGESAKGDNLTLFGIADPLAQDGGGAVSGVTAHLTGQSIDPAPKPGFAGAAATDEQGRFAGIVELKAPAVAGNGNPGPQAVLVPADTVRAFLTAHGITSAAGHGPMDQSVVRVICVRR